MAFLTRATSDDMQKLIADFGFEMHSLREGAFAAAPQFSSNSPELELRDAASTIDALGGQAIEWIVVDHYGLAAKWEAAVRQSDLRILAIDDLGRRHRCDLLLDQNYRENPERCYSALVGSGCHLLVGPQYALLRPQFYGDVRRPAGRRATIKRILVSFGASDPTGETVKVLECLLEFPEDAFDVDVLVDPRRVPVDLLARVRKRGDIRLQGWVEDVASLMRVADLAIGAGGSTAWERCLLGLPALVITVADNQHQSMIELAGQGAIWLLGKSADVKASDIRDALERCAAAPKRVHEMGARASQVVGTAKVGVAAVADAMEALR